MKTAFLTVAAAVAAFAGSAVAGPVVGLSGFYFVNELDSALTGAGNTVVQQPDLTQPIVGFDTIFILRDKGLSPVEAANVIKFIEDGGCVTTEFSSTNYWFDGTLASYTGTNLNGFHVPSGNVGGGNTITVTDPLHPVTAGVTPSPWISGEPIGVFQVYPTATLDAAIATPVQLLGDPTYGDLPVIGVVNIGLGTAHMFFTDYADFVPANFTPQEMTLLGNALCTAIPAPSALGVLALGGLAASRRRR